MSGSHGTLMTDPGDVRRLTQDLAWDLACASGTLSEIATCWRRALGSMPEFPASLPLRLQDATAQVAAEIRPLALADPARRAALALSAAGRFAALKDDAAAARAMAVRVAADAELWDSLAGVLDRAGKRLLSLILAAATVTDWSLNSEPPAGTSKA
jgi:hypothetical protein